MCIRDIADLFDLRISDLCGADGSRERSAMNMLRGIEESKQKPFHKVVFALGIRFVGKVAAKTLAEHFKSMDALCEAGEEELQAIPGIGPRVYQKYQGARPETRQHHTACRNQGEGCVGWRFRNHHRHYRGGS